jgi:hypothetical protein
MCVKNENPLAAGIATDAEAKKWGEALPFRAHIANCAMYKPNKPKKLLSLCFG